MLDARRPAPCRACCRFYFRDEVLPYYAGDDAAARDLAANDFKYWELMRRACERGYRVFDYGRSKRGTGSFDFKKNWGFEPEPLHYEFVLLRGEAVPQNNPLEPEVPGDYRAVAAAAASGGELARAAHRARPGLRLVEPLLFLAHRIPYPPNKGDKVRSYHLFQHLASGTGCSSAPSSTTRSTASTLPTCARCAPAAGSSSWRRTSREAAGASQACFAAKR